MLQQAVHETAVIALCPQELLKIRGVYLVVRLIAHAVALDLPIIDPQHGPAADHIEAAIDTEEFQRSGDVGELLELVKEEQGLAWQEPLARVQAGNIFDNRVRLIPIGRDELVLGLLHEIDIDHVLIAALGKPLGGFCLAHLPGAP